MGTSESTGLERREISFRVYRMNPQADAKAYYDDYKVTLEKGVTVLRALNFIKENLEPRLSYRLYCQAGICGSCAMRINGVSRLACTTQVWELLEHSADGNTITVEPLKNLEVMRDLVVDMKPVVSKMVQYSTWVESTMSRDEMGKKEFVIQEDDFIKYDKATDCILCASCYSECTILEANKKFVSPLIMLRAYRMNVDERDGAGSKRTEALVQDTGMWDCTHCFRCVEACVKRIPIMDAIHEIRHEAIMKRGAGDTEGSRHGVVFLDDIKSKGKLVEATLPIRTWGIFKTMKMIPFALKMAQRGKQPPVPFMMHKDPSLSKVREMYKILKTKKKDHKH